MLFRSQLRNIWCWIFWLVWIELKKKKKRKPKLYSNLNQILLDYKYIAGFWMITEGWKYFSLAVLFPMTVKLLRFWDVWGQVKVWKCFWNNLFWASWILNVKKLQNIWIILGLRQFHKVERSWVFVVKFISWKYPTMGLTEPENLHFYIMRKHGGFIAS